MKLASLLKFPGSIALFLACVLLGLGTVWAGPGKAAKQERQAAADALFTNGYALALRIEISPAAVRSLHRNRRNWVRATIKEGDTIYTNISLRIKGGAGSSRPLEDKPGLSLKLDETGSAFHGLKKFHLNNSVQDDTYLSEWVCSQMFRQAGVPTPRAAHALVELNGRPLGLFVLLESVDKEFLAQYFKNPHGHVYSQSPNADVDDSLELRSGKKDDAGRGDIDALTAAARSPTTEHLSQALDLDRFISFEAMEVMLDHWDGYTLNVKNYSVYHDLDANRIVFFPHDLDQVLRDSRLSVVPRARGMVSQAILKNPETRRRYLNRFSELYTNVFAVPDWPARIDAMAAKLAASIKDRDPSLARELKANAKNFEDRWDRRVLNLKAQLQLPGFGTPQFSNGVAHLRGWRAVHRQPGAKLEKVKDETGKTELKISATASTSASWRVRVALEPGHYIFEGMARTAEIEPPADATMGGGAGLWVAGTNSRRQERLLGDCPGKPLKYEFRISDEFEEVELACELRASKGQVWFDESSLQIRRLDQP